MEPSKSAATKSISHTKTRTVDCWAQNEVAGKEPTLNEMLDICKTILLKPEK
jgi:hypothetical protein